MDDLTSHSLEYLAAAIKKKQLSPVELTTAALAAIEAEDPALNAYISTDPTSALEQARTAEKAIMSDRYLGPLHGIPMGIKDNFYVENQITTMGSKIHASFVPEHSATAVKRLRAAGIVQLGKHNLHEYALGVTTENPRYGDTLNPWDRNKIAGGSSGGAGTAIATGMSIGSIGSDTSGSIRIPASCCGVVGLKPTYGRISKFGCYPEAWTLDTVGPMARTVTDTALILDAISGHDSQDPTSLALSATQTATSLSSDVNGLKIGVNEDFFFADIDKPIAENTRQTISALEHLGATVVPVDIPHIEDAEYAITMIDTAEATTVHHRALAEQPDDYGNDVRFLLKCGVIVSAVDYLEAQQIRALLQQSFTQTFSEVDVLMAPTLPIETPTLRQTTSLINGAVTDTEDALMRLVGPANLLGLPAISVPNGFVDGMPVGLQIIGPPLSEQQILNTGLAVEKLLAS